MSPTLRTLAFFALCEASLQGCTAANLGDYCKGTSLDKADSSSLGLVLGAPTRRFTEPPSFALHSPNRAESQAVLELSLTPIALSWPADLDETPCKGLDWRTFRVKVDADQWKRFLALPRPAHFEGHIGFTDSLEPLRMAEFGFALVDLTSGKALLSCGCYWT